MKKKTPPRSGPKRSCHCGTCATCKQRARIQEYRRRLKHEAAKTPAESLRLAATYAEDGALDTALTLINAAAKTLREEYVRMKKLLASEPTGRKAKA